MQAPSPSFVNGLPYYAKLALLVVASVVFALCFACATPIVAFGTLAALTLSRRHALGLVAAIWLANQLVGYGILNYPTDFSSYAWGAVLGVAALCAVWVACSLAEQFKDDATALLVLPFMASFAVYQGVMLVAALFIGGMEGMAPEIIGWAGVVNALTFVGLYGANRVLDSLAPRAALPVRVRA
jgi:hypothetical protein